MTVAGRAPGRWTAVFSGGGTGGHLYPALALAQALEQVRPDVTAVFVGAQRGVEARVLPQRGVDHHLLPVEGFRRGARLPNVAVLAKLLRSLAQVADLFQRRRPQVVVVTGGYAGGPAGIMAAIMGVHLVLQEQNAVPGITTRLLAPFARQIHLAFPEAVGYLPRRSRARARISGNPVRSPRPVDRGLAARRFELDPERPVVLVVGGSQGARAINEAVMAALNQVLGESARHPEKPTVPDAEGAESIVHEGHSPSTTREAPAFQLLWSTGPAHLEGVQERLASLGSPSWVRAVGYIDAMDEALGLAHLAVSRAGAMATAEFLAWGLPAILIPLPGAAADHQRQNAQALARAGAAVVEEEETLNGQLLWRRIGELATDMGAHKRMAEAARSRGRPNAATRIAGELSALLPRPVQSPSVTGDASPADSPGASDPGHGGPG